MKIEAKVRRRAHLGQVVLALSVWACAPHALTQTTSTTGECSPTATSCSVNNQTLGDTSTPSSATGTTSNSSQSGTSSTSNVSSLTLSPINAPKTQQNSTNTTTGTISGGNVSGGNTTGGNTNGTITGGNNTAQGGAVTGNTTSANNQSSATTGASTATTGPTSNTLSVGAPTASAGANNASTSIDASNRSVSAYNEKTIFIPPIVPPTPPTSLAIGNIIKETGACGPLQRVVREPVEGSFFGFVKNTRVQQGYTERLAPYVDEHGFHTDYRRVPLENGMGYRLFGHQVTQYTTILGVSGARNIALGGGGSSGAWGQAGAGASSTLQQLVTTIQIRDCEIGSFETQPPPSPPPPRIVYVEPKHIRE